MIYKLKKPIQYDGKTIEEIDMNFDSLTGKDMIDAEREADTDDFTPMKEFNKSYLAIIAAKACSMPSDIMPLLGLKDFSAITRGVQNFLFNEE